MKLKHKVYRCVNPAHVAPAIAQYPALTQQNLHLDQVYTDADLAPYTSGGVECFVDFESPGPIAEDATTFTAARMTIAAYAIAELKLAPSDGAAQNCVGLYSVSGGGMRFDPTNNSFYAPGTGLISAEKAAGLFRYVDFVAADAYIKSDDPQYWLDTLDCALRAFRTASRPGLLFFSPRLMDNGPNRTLVNLDVFNARLWNARMRLDAGDYVAACYWDLPDLSGLDAAGQATVLAAADAHAAKFATIFSIGL